MEKRDDLRIIRTKLSIKNAFYELIEEKSFAKISIRDIAERAMINRTTFYLHYQDKYDLMASLEDEVLNELGSHAKSITKEYIEDHIKNSQPFPHLVKELEFIEQNSSFFKLMVKDPMGTSFYNRVGEIISSKLHSIYPEVQENALIKKYSKSIAIALFSSIINQWVQDGMQEDKTEISILLSKSIITMLQTS